MPALFFPNLDALRLALTSGLVPASVAQSLSRAGFDTQGHLWLEPSEFPSREALTALGRLGVLPLRSTDVPTQTVRSWAEVLPLRRAEPPRGGLVLFEVADHKLAQFAARLRRSESAVGLRLLSEPHAGRAWVSALSPPLAAFLWLDETDPTARAFQQQSEGVWVLRGWEHPLVAQLAIPEGSVLLCAPEREVECVAGPVPFPRLEELPLRAGPVAPQPPVPTPRVDVRFRLRKRDEARDEVLWVLTPSEVEDFARLCRGADEQFLRRFEVATVHANAEARLLVRRADPADGVAVLQLGTRGHAADPRLPSLFVPADHVLRPAIRAHELARELAVSPDRVVWLEPADGGVAVNSVAASAFRPLWERVEYVVPPPEALAAEVLPEEAFPFDRFAIQVETSIDIEVDPEPEPATAIEVEEPPREPAEGEPGWMSKSVTRMLRWVRGQRQRAERDAASAEGDEVESRKTARPENEAASDRVERKLASADALLHGHDWAARRHELESRLLADFPRLTAEGRAQRWAELAGVYGATGRAFDGAVCWMNALWECPTPPGAWLEQWAAAECRAARRGDRGPDLERWLSEPARPGTGRVIAALAALFGFSPAPPPEFVSALPRVLAVLEQHFDDIPARGAWLARLAVARSCDGDVLGLARWRDRLVRRLYDRGPALDLDEPSFLRFRGSATAERFKTASEWLVRMHDPILKWVRKHAEGSRGLEWAGLDGEGEATAAYAQFLLAWGLGALGERTRSREWAAWARKSLARGHVARADPAGHAVLGDLFRHRIKEAHEGQVPKPVLPAELQERLDKLPWFARYSVDRLREHCRVLQPVGVVRAFRWLDLRPFLGHDELGDRLALLGVTTDPTELNNEAKALLAQAEAESNKTTVPRIVFALLEVAPMLDPSAVWEMLDRVPDAIDWTEGWVQTGRGTDAERADRVTRFQARMIEGAFVVAPAAAAQRLLRFLTRGATAGPLLPAAAAAAAGVFRAARKHTLAAEAESLVRVLDPTRAESKSPVTAERVALAMGWFVAGDEVAGNRVLDVARDALFQAPWEEVQKRTAVALAYAEALGFAPAGIAPAGISLGRLEELFQRLDRVTVQHSSNCYFTLQPLRLIDTVVRAVVTDEFTLSPAVRGWLDGDEFLIRRRIHADMAAVLREGGLA